MGYQLCSRHQQILHGFFRAPSLKTRATIYLKGWVSAVLVLFKLASQIGALQMCVFLVVHFQEGSWTCPDDVNRAGQFLWLGRNMQQCPLAVNVHQHKRLNLDTGSTESRIFKTFSLIYNHALGERWKYQRGTIKFHMYWRLSRAEMYKLIHLSGSH